MAAWGASKACATMAGREGGQEGEGEYMAEGTAARKRETAWPRERRGDEEEGKSMGGGGRRGREGEHGREVIINNLPLCAAS